jgi:hypothetical protein
MDQTCGWSCPCHFPAQTAMKTLVLQYKTMQKLLNFFDSKPVASPGKMKWDMHIMKKCLSHNDFKVLLADQSGTAPWPASIFIFVFLF